MIVTLFALLHSGLCALAEVFCPPPLKMLSSSPSHLSEGVSTEATVIITWDKNALSNLTEGLRDLKPALESVNIAGGRYGIGTLLTTEWGVGGNASWKDNEEVITPEAPLEPGTQYRLWTYLYMTIRDGAPVSCARVGGEVVFRTSGITPSDGNPVREIDLSKIYHGDEYGHGDIMGRVKALNQALGIITVDDKMNGEVSLVIYKGIPVFKGGQTAQLGMIHPGDEVAIRLTGGRAVTVEVNK